MKVLYASSEAHPLIKTGGLADVAGSLPDAIAQLGHKVKLVLPAYQAITDHLCRVSVVSQFNIGGAGRSLQVRLLKAELPEFKAKVILVDIPELFNRPGNPYLGPDGRDWWDNGERFAVFSRVVAEIAMDRAGLKWKADVVHANDWQTGLVPAFLSQESQPPRTLFTVHNMSYAGYFPKSLFDSLWLPWEWWTPEGVEFYSQLSMLKAGISYADWVTTVSPTYAKEICYPELAYGFEGILSKRQEQGRLVGILNGIDDKVWNPEIDRYISYNYSAKKGRVSQKKRNKEVLLALLGDHDPHLHLDQPLIGFVGRLIEQKGIDLILQVLPELLQEQDVRFVFVGAGQAEYEHQLRELAAAYPGRVFVHIGYSEPLAHQVEAGADMFLMPSRFEPCGLNQMYSLAYGTLPIVHHTGGLADTVVNATPENIKNKTATGFMFYDPNPHALRATILHALSIFNKPRSWQQIQKTGMEQPFNWKKSAKNYVELYSKEL
ncbi:glycogen synthase GlgA [Thiomicrospira sp. R3]|uniref:glycogen synthase GlgA n=1 Tax=Thiomicrospira sp. R3 TaxID=3035472 RepID=UPI00259BC74A|nr:glycogen synthase GlgA [Thiomicrospira sp. R3]WFE68161.1 glycogen synthase GlgA [Thiomicrospira sp. R3]